MKPIPRPIYYSFYQIAISVARRFDTASTSAIWKHYSSHLAENSYISNFTRRFGVNFYKIFPVPAHFENALIGNTV